MNDIHEKYMKRCLELAAQAKLNNKTAVGSLIVQDGVIIAEGIEGSTELPDILAHAEVVAIIKAIEFTGSKNLSNCTLYTTVEPCFMCSYLIRQSKIKEIIYGISTPETGGASSEYPILTAMDIQKWHPTPVVIDGILEGACRNILIR